MAIYCLSPCFSTQGLAVLDTLTRLRAEFFSLVYRLCLKKGISLVNSHKEVFQVQRE